jgi:hypothetical protein
MVNHLGGIDGVLNCGSSPWSHSKTLWELTALIIGIHCILSGIKLLHSVNEDRIGPRAINLLLLLSNKTLLLGVSHL